MIDIAKWTIQFCQHSGSVQEANREGWLASALSLILFLLLSNAAYTEGLFRHKTSTFCAQSSSHLTNGRVGTAMSPPWARGAIIGGKSSRLAAQAHAALA